MLDETVITRLVKPEDLNPHGTLFAGQMAKWLIEAGTITAAQLFKTIEGIVLVKFTDMNFTRPIPNGHLAVIKSKIAYLGKSTITVSSRVSCRFGSAASGASRCWIVANGTGAAASRRISTAADSRIPSAFGVSVAK